MRSRGQHYERLGIDSNKAFGGFGKIWQTFATELRGLDSTANRSGNQLTHKEAGREADKQAEKIIEIAALIGVLS